MVASAVLFLVLGEVLGVLGEGDLEAGFVVLVETVVLEGVKGDGGLHHILEVNKTKQIVPAAVGCLLYQPDALVPWKGPENVCLPPQLRLTSRYDASLGTPSTYRLLVASLGM